MREKTTSAITHTESTLAAVADLKATAIAQWRGERLGDARVLAANPHIAASLSARRENPNSTPPSDSLDRYFDALIQNYNHAAVALYDQDLRLVLARLNIDQTLPPLTTETAVALREQPEQVSESLEAGADGVAAFELIHAVRDTHGAFLGAVRLRADPRALLYPLLMSWPAPGRSGENLLMRKVGDQIIALAGTRMRPEAGFALTYPLDQRERHAVQAFTEPNRGLRRALDYRDTEVFGLAREVPDSDWIIVAKLDANEALAPARALARNTAIALGGLFLLLGAGLRFIWRERQAGLVARHLAAESQRHQLARRLGLLMQTANDGILLFDESMRLVEANERAVELYGRPLSALVGCHASELRAPKTASAAPADFDRVLRSGGGMFETLHLRADGTIFPVEVSAQAVDADGRRHVLSIVRDITERKRQEYEIEQLGRLYRVISQVNQVMLRASSQAELLKEICRVLVESGGFSIAWAGWLRSDTRLIEPVAVAGDNAGYVSGITISADPAVPEGRGPSGMAFRENRPHVCPDFFADPTTVPWHERARQAGFRSTIALPLRIESRPAGLLSVYASEVNFFHGRALTLLQEAADNVSFMLDVFAARARRDAAELALAAREEIYSSIVNQAMDAIVLVDGETGSFVEFNTAAHHGLGYTREEFAKLDVSRIQTQPSPGLIREDLTRIRTSGGLVFNTQHRHRDGSARDVRVSARAVRVRGHDYVAAVWSDITETRRLEANLRQSEESYRELFELESDAILLFEADTGHIVRTNPAACALYGHTADDMLALRHVDLSAEPENTLAAIPPANRRLGEIVHVPQRMHRRRDGSIFPVEINLRFFRRDGQDLCLAALRDISMQVAARETLERFTAELEQQVDQRTAELAARNREIQALLQAVPDTLLRLKADGTVYDARPARGSKTLAELVPANGPISAALLRECLDLGVNALRDGQSVVAERPILGTSGPLAVELRAAPLGAEEFVVFVRDVTARKKLEAETAAMLERERQISEMKSRFISVTSHEFRTPLAVAMGSIELLQNHADRLTPEKRDEIFARINGAIRRLTEMIDDVLTLSRIETGRQSVHLAACDLTRLLRSHVEEARLGDRDAHPFRFETDCEPVDAITDPAVLHHICANLLSNAARYSPPGTVVSLHLEVAPQANTITVEDEGIGIPEADRTRIFEPFERGSNVGTVKGTGLGLNIVKRMVDLLGGSIMVEPRLPRGTRFRVTLPRLAPPPQP